MGRNLFHKAQRTLSLTPHSCPSPVPLWSSSRGDRVETKVEQRWGGGKKGRRRRESKICPWLLRRVGFTATFMDCYPTGPCFEQSRCSVNVRLMD